jgi:hypothetical protein
MGWKELDMEDKKDVIFLKPQNKLSKERFEKLYEIGKHAAEELGIKVLILNHDIDAVVDRDYGKKLDMLIEEQRKTNELLSLKLPELQK